MVIEPGLHPSPRAQRLLAWLSCLGIFLLLLLAGQGCGKNPSDKTARFSEAYERGLEAAGKHDHDLAIVEFSNAIQLKPDDSPAHYNRANAYSDKGDYDKAIADYSEAIHFEPDYVAAYYNRGNAYGYKSDWGKAIADETEAIQLNPDFAEAYHARGVFYNRNGDYAKAKADFYDAVRLGPKDALAYNTLAWLLAVCPDANVRNGEFAVEYAVKACELTEGKEASMLSAVAAAYAEAGRFDDAVKWQDKYLDSDYLKSNPVNDTPEKARQRLHLYEQNKPYREQKP